MGGSIFYFIFLSDINHCALSNIKYCCAKHVVPHLFFTCPTALYISPNCPSSALYSSNRLPIMLRCHCAVQQVANRILDQQYYWKCVVVSISKNPSVKNTLLISLLGPVWPFLDLVWPFLGLVRPHHVGSMYHFVPAKYLLLVSKVR